MYPDSPRCLGPAAASSGAIFSMASGRVSIPNARDTLALDGMHCAIQHPLGTAMKAGHRRRPRQMMLLRRWANPAQAKGDKPGRGARTLGGLSGGQPRGLEAYVLGLRDAINKSFFNLLIRSLIAPLASRPARPRWRHSLKSLRYPGGCPLWHHTRPSTTRGGIRNAVRHRR
jgi:hypothetical protein